MSLEPEHQPPLKANSESQVRPESHFDDLAERIALHRLSGSALFIPEQARPKSELEAYALQSRVNSILAHHLGQPCGFKIGCTTPVMQQFLGIHSPCAGDVFESTAFQGATTIKRSAYRRVGVECEIVAILSRDIPPDSTPFTADSIFEYVAAFAAGIEIVDDRYQDYRSLGAPSLIADNFFNAGIVLGEPVSGVGHSDLRAVSGRMTINDEIAGTGHGAMVMDNPLNSLAWIANSRTSRGFGLRRGDFVFLGSLVETKWVEAGDRVNVSLDGFHDVDLLVR